MRIKEIVCGTDYDHLEFILNRPVEVNLPCPVWFKAGEDCAKLIEIKDGTHFIFEGGPKNEVRVGESIHIRNSELKVGGPTFLDYELEKIDKIKGSFERWYLSYVYEQKHIDEFREIIGNDPALVLKIENKQGLKFVTDQYVDDSSTFLMAARGDLYVELKYPHEILNACKLIIQKDRHAFVGSRMLLSLINSSIPSCSDLFELAGLYEMGYNNFLLCDELCLKENMLGAAVNVFDAFRKEYCS